MLQSFSTVDVHFICRTKNPMYLIGDHIKNSLVENSGNICNILYNKRLNIERFHDPIRPVFKQPGKIAQMPWMGQINEHFSNCSKTKSQDFSSLSWLSRLEIFSLNPKETKGIVTCILNGFKLHNKVSYQDEF